jgi:hypothetical protein
VNIIILPNGTEGYNFRPDNTLVRDSNDFYPPDIITHIGVTICFVIRISKPAKYTYREFAKKYYSEYGLGIVIYPENLLQPDIDNIVSSGRAFSMDNTTYISDFFSQVDEICCDKSVILKMDDLIVFSEMLGANIIEKIDTSIEEVSKYSSLKSGDLLFIELSKRLPVNFGSNLNLSYGGKYYLDFCIR